MKRPDYQRDKTRKRSQPLVVPCLLFGFQHDLCAENQVVQAAPLPVEQGESNVDNQCQAGIKADQSSDRSRWQRSEHVISGRSANR